MDMELNLNVKGLTIEVTPVVRKDNIKGFVIWTFITDCGEIKVKGGTVRIKEFGSQKLLSYDFPAYKAGFKYHKSVYMSNLELYKTLCKATVDKYCSLTGELPNEIQDEEINLDDIPL